MPNLNMSSTLISGMFSFNVSKPNWYWYSNTLYNCLSQWANHGFMLFSENPFFFLFNWIIIYFNLNWLMAEQTIWTASLMTCLISYKLSFHFCCCLSRSVLIKLTTISDIFWCSLRSFRFSVESFSAAACKLIVYLSRSSGLSQVICPLEPFEPLGFLISFSNYSALSNISDCWQGNICLSIEL